MDPFVVVATATLPSSASRSPSSTSDDVDDDDEDDDAAAAVGGSSSSRNRSRHSDISTTPSVDHLVDEDSVVFVGEVSEPAIGVLCDVDICIQDDDGDGDDGGSGQFSPRRVMSTPAQHECQWDGCRRQFVHLDDMVAHVNDDHMRMDDLNYTCKWEGCPRQGRSFNARYKMLIHMRTHTNEKPHRCPTCDKRFSRSENLKIHTRSHTGEKPYVCPIKGCGKAYSNSSDRFKHTRTHFDDRPFVCKRAGCGKRYTDPSSLRKHTKTFGHRDQPNTINKSVSGVSGNTSGAIATAIDLSDVGTSLLFDPRVRYGTLMMHPGNTVSLGKSSKRLAVRKSKNMGIKNNVSSIRDASAKLPAAAVGQIDHRTITLD